MLQALFLANHPAMRLKVADKQGRVIGEEQCLEHRRLIVALAIANYLDVTLRSAKRRQREGGGPVAATEDRSSLQHPETRWHAPAHAAVVAIASRRPRCLIDDVEQYLGRYTTDVERGEV